MVEKHSKVTALKWNLDLQKPAGEAFGAREVLGCCSGPIPWGWADFGSAAAPPSQLWQWTFLLVCTPQPPQPADWWFKLGMWSTQMSSSRRSLFSRIISLTTHFSLSLSWLHSRDLPACLVWDLTAATLLDPPWCILFSLKLIRGAIAYSTSLGDRGVGCESYIWNEKKDHSGMNSWGFSCECQ